MKKSILLIITIVFCASLSGQTGINLRLNPEKNKVYKLHSIAEQTILQTINGNQQTIESKSVYSLSLKMVDSSPAFIVAEIRFDTIDTKTNTMGKVVRSGSALGGNIESKETSEIMSFFMNSLTRNSLYAKIDYSGKVSEIMNSKMISDKILKDTSLITLTGPTSSALKGQIINMVSDNSLRTLIDMFTNNLPGKEVNTGDNWSSVSSTNAGGMSLDITTVYHLTSVSGNTASISAESNIRAAANAVPMESGGAKITYDDFKGLSKSAISIETVTGFIIENTSKTRITGNLGVSVPGMNMQIPMDINSDSKTIILR